MTILNHLEETPNTLATFLYGTISCGADTWVSALGKGSQVFSYDGRLRSKNTIHRTNYHRTNWAKYPNLNLLIVQENTNSKISPLWLKDWGSPIRARNILVFHGIHSLTCQLGKGYKNWCQGIKGRGYDTVTWQIDASKCGASLWSGYLVTFCYPKGNKLKPPLQLDSTTVTRPCYNVLRTYNIHKKQYHDSSNILSSNHPRHINYQGTYLKQPVYHWDGPACGQVERSWVHIPDHGVRRIQLDELEKLKGLHNSMYDNITPSILYSSVEQHVWACLGQTIAPFLIESPDTPPPNHHDIQSPPTPTPSSGVDNWTWNHPDLSEGSDFYNQRVHNLQNALLLLGPNHDHLFKQGLELLAAHRTNYSSDGPKSLVVLWWEWPPLHWMELREGVSMNFMENPQPGMVSNQDLKGEELKEAVKFVDELIALRVLQPPPTLLKILNNFPLFLVPKPGQPGQFRTIADGKAGGQNKVCVADPCHMTSPDHILPYLYPGGFSATLDLSKYFHMFLTHPEEYQHLGLLHPKNLEPLVYRTLPMGTRNSPGASGRFGAAFIRLVMDSSELFQGTAIDNSLNGYFTQNINHPTLGEGRILIGPDGLPAVLIWLHVDDLFIHAPTLSKLQAALDHILLITLKLGLICHPSKTSPPSQRVKYCGFEYDTSSTPTIHIPHNKISRAIAMIEYLISGITPTHSRLIVSMVVGFLQSLVPATPGNIGASFLRPVYEDLHSLVTGIAPNTRKAYFCAMDLSEKSQLCLQWWIDALTCGMSKQCQPVDISTLCVTWGDGSGTGAGGTFNLASSTNISQTTTLSIWKGVWGSKVAHFSSNWKELRTLLYTLEHEKFSGGDQVRGRRLIYFTDNMVSYDVFRKGSSKSTPLWRLFLKIKLLEMELQCVLQVIHVPGTAMIEQGTDGLSRGVTMQSLGSHRSNSLIPLLWRAAPPSLALLQWVLAVLPPVYPPGVQWLLHTDFSDWTKTAMLNSFVFWCPSPGFAKQAILQALSVWVEAPTSCGHIFLVPRLLQRDFGRLSKFVLFHGQYNNLPLPFTPLVPFVLYYIPPFDRLLTYQLQRSQEDNRLDLPPDSIPSWIRKEIDSLLRVSSST